LITMHIVRIFPSMSTAQITLNIDRRHRFNTNVVHPYKLDTWGHV
jgi:hypothetical protein